MNVRIALFILLIPCSPARMRGSTVEEFEKAAAHQRFLDVGCILYDRLDGPGCVDQAVGELVRRDYPVSDLEVFTRHCNPRFRTLGFGCLFAYSASGLLPRLL